MPNRVLGSLKWPLRVIAVGAITFTAALVGGVAGPVPGGLAAAAVAVVSELLSQHALRALQERLDKLEAPKSLRQQSLDDRDRRERDLSARIASGDRNF